MFTESEEESEEESSEEEGSITDRLREKNGIYGEDDSDDEEQK